MNAERGTRNAESQERCGSTTSLICFALNEESGAFREIESGRLNASIVITGIGRKNATNVVRTILGNETPRQVFTCGFAGGLNPELATGDVIFETSDPALGNKLTSAGAKSAKFFCAQQIATTVVEKRELRSSTGADAVEMESEAIHALCHERGIPCATVRVISDAAHEDLPLDFNALSRPDLSLHYGKLALAIAKSPGKIPALLRLQKSCRVAAQRLAEVLTRVIEAR